MLRALAAAAALSLLACASAAAVSPAVGVARELEASMTSYYKAQKLVFTTVTCKIEAGGSKALCSAHFVQKAKHADGVFTVQVTETAAGTAQTKTLEVACRNSITGAKQSC